MVPPQKYFQVVEYFVSPEFFVFFHGTEGEMKKNIFNSKKDNIHNIRFSVKTSLSLFTILKKIKSVFQERQLETFLPYKKAFIQGGCTEEQILCAELENAKLSDLIPVLNSIEHFITNETED